MIEKLLGIIEDQSNIINRLTGVIEKLTGPNESQQSSPDEESFKPLKGKKSFSSVRDKLEQLHTKSYINEHHPEQTEEYWLKRSQEELSKLKGEVNESSNDAGTSREDEGDRVIGEGTSEYFQEEEKEAV